MLKYVGWIFQSKMIKDDFLFFSLHSPTVYLKNSVNHKVLCFPLFRSNNIQKPYS